MADGDRCDCGSSLDLRDILVDTATGPSIIVTVCGLCAAGPVSPCPVPASVARILARRAACGSPENRPPQPLRPMANSFYRDINTRRVRRNGESHARLRHCQRRCVR